MKELFLFAEKSAINFTAIGGQSQRRMLKPLSMESFESTLEYNLRGEIIEYRPK